MIEKRDTERAIGDVIELITKGFLHIFITVIPAIAILTVIGAWTVMALHAVGVIDMLAIIGVAPFGAFLLYLSTGVGIALAIFGYIAISELRSSKRTRQKASPPPECR